MLHSPDGHLSHRPPTSARHRPAIRLLAACFAVAVAALMPTAAALAQASPDCAASSDTPRSAADVIADVARQRCPAGSRLRVVMTIAGQAIVLQQSGTCEREGFRTMSRTTSDGSRGLGVTCTIAAR